jgi:hypothetical protein
VILDSGTEWFIGKGLEPPENRMVGARPFAPSRWRPRNRAPGIVKIPVRNANRTDFSQSPVTSDQPEETIALIPYAAAKLRITAFAFAR